MRCGVCHHEMGNQGRPRLDAKPVATFADHALVDRNSSQPQCVADHADRGERHGGRRDDRRQKNVEARIEHASGNRHARAIVNEREEEVLPYVAHRSLRKAARAHYSLQVALEERDARALYRHVRAVSRGFVADEPVSREPVSLCYSLFSPVMFGKTGNFPFSWIDLRSIFFQVLSTFP